MCVAKNNKFVFSKFGGKTLFNMCKHQDTNILPNILVIIFVEVKMPTTEESIGLQGAEHERGQRKKKST